MLGRQFSHWSYYFNSEASFLEGNRIADHGSGAFRFETTETITGFSKLDLYLMGLLPPAEVPANFFVRNPSIFDNLFDEAHEPLAGIFFDGERVEVTIGDIIAAHGPRAPDHTVSQRNFRYAFILLKQEGEEAPPRRHREDGTLSNGVRRILRPSARQPRTNRDEAGSQARPHHLARRRRIARKYYRGLCLPRKPHPGAG